MKKSVIFLAAGFSCGLLHAQTSVTLYGVVDTSIEYVNRVGSVPLPTNGYNPGEGKSVVRMNSGGFAASRWGIRGQEDLGGGLKALFVLESGFLSDSGRPVTSSFFDRQAYVGVQSGKYGRFTFGRQYTSLFSGIAESMPAAYALQYEPIVIVGGPNFRESNVVQYATIVGPLTFIAHWSFGAGLSLPPTSPAAPQAFIGGAGEVPGKMSANSGYGAALTYSAGKLGMTVA